MRPKKSISYTEVIDLIPGKLLDEIALETEVDKSVSKLTGKNMFSLLLYGLTSGRSVSHAILASIFNSPIFKLAGKKQSINSSAIGHRLKNMNSEYFRQIFEYLAADERVERLMGIAGKKYVVKKIDSTIVTLTAKLIKFGMNISKGNKELKFSACITNGIPTDIELFTEQKYASEDKALPEIIHKEKTKHGGKGVILLFDRGIQKRDTYDEINRTPNRHFITRLSTQHYKVDKINSRIKGRKAGKLTLISDEVIHFETKTEKRETEYRLIKAVNPETKTEYRFLTNILFLNAVEICALYKQRWEIETFFKFIKQQMSFSHLLSRSENGVKTTMYMTMIASILIAIYKKVNKITGWTISKIYFMQELEIYIIKTFFEELAPVFGYSKTGLSEANPHIFEYP